MLRALGYLILALIGITLIRSVIGVLAKMFSSNVSGSPGGGTSARSRRNPQPIGGVLQKDPVCGTFIPESTAKRLTSGGQTHYFCSEECLRKFQSSGGAEA